MTGFTIVLFTFQSRLNRAQSNGDYRGYNPSLSLNASCPANDSGTPIDKSLDVVRNRGELKELPSHKIKTNRGNEDLKSLARTGDLQPDGIAFVLCTPIEPHRAYRLVLATTTWAGNALNGNTDIRICFC